MNKIFFSLFVFSSLFAYSAHASYAHEKDFENETFCSVSRFDSCNVRLCYWPKSTETTVTAKWIIEDNKAEHAGTNHLMVTTCDVEGNGLLISKIGANRDANIDREIKALFYELSVNPRWTHSKTYIWVDPFSSLYNLLKEQYEFEVNELSIKAAPTNGNITKPKGLVQLISTKAIIASNLLKKS